MGEGVYPYAGSSTGLYVIIIRPVWVVVLKKSQARVMRRRREKTKQNTDPPSSTRKRVNVRSLSQGSVAARMGNWAGSCKILPFRPGMDGRRRGKGPPKSTQRQRAEYNQSLAPVAAASPLSILLAPMPVSTRFMGDGEKGRASHLWILRHWQADALLRCACGHACVRRGEESIIGKEMAYRYARAPHTPVSDDVPSLTGRTPGGRAGTARVGKHSHLKGSPPSNPPAVPSQPGLMQPAPFAANRDGFRGDARWPAGSLTTIYFYTWQSTLLRATHTKLTGGGVIKGGLISREDKSGRTCRILHPSDLSKTPPPSGMCPDPFGPFKG